MYVCMYVCMYVLVFFLKGRLYQRMLLHCWFFRLLDLAGSYCRVLSGKEVRLGQRILCQTIGTTVVCLYRRDCGDWRVVALAVNILQ